MFEICDFIIPDVVSLHVLRGTLARLLLGFKSAKRLRLRKGIEFGAGYYFMTIGPDCYIGRNCTLDAYDKPITIGSNVYIANETMIWTGSHEIGDEKQRCGRLKSRSITIGDGVWIGLRSLIRNDVGTGSIVNAMALVVKPVEPNTLVQGVPAIPVKSLSTNSTDV